MLDSNLNDLHPLLRPLAEIWLQTYTATGRKARITQTWRTGAEQAALHAANPTEALPSGESLHEFTLSDGSPASKAFDFALFSTKGSYITDGRHPWYADAGLIGKKLGLVWGGDFHHPDPDHFQLKEN